MTSLMGSGIVSTTGGYTIAPDYSRYPNQKPIQISDEVADALNRYKPSRMGVDPDGNPVFYDPEKAKAKKMEALKEKQRKAIQEILDSGRSIDPTKDKVFIDPKTGELTTIKPGLYTVDESQINYVRPKNPGLFDPESQRKNAERRAKVATALLGVSTLAAAIFFRKQIGGVVGKTAGKIFDMAGGAVKFVKNHAQDIAAKVIKFFGKGTVA
ncbi:MAG: hypothetical protein NC191_04065 [Muribaculaceae bacterium]|nr:hypothetical protein [Muribaculaceae bacterium]